MARTHFYHTVWRENPSTHVFEPLEDVLATVYPVDNTGVQGGSEATVFTGRTGVGVPADMLTDDRGVIEFFFNIGDYNVVFSDTQIPARIADFTIGIASISGADGSISASKLAGGITSAQLAGSIAANKLAGSILASQLAGSITEDKITSLPTTKLTGTITNAQLAGSILEAKIVSLPTTKLTGTITNAQLAGVIGQDKLDGDIMGDQLNKLSVIETFLPQLDTLPSSPVHGEEFVWVPNPTTMGLEYQPYWRMKFNQFSGKWHFVGGEPGRTAEFVRNDIVGTGGVPGTNQAVAAGLNTNQEWTPANRITIPKAGDWHFKAKCPVRWNVTGRLADFDRQLQLAVRGSSYTGPIANMYLPRINYTHDPDPAITVGVVTVLYVIDDVATIASDGFAVWLSHESPTYSDGDPGTGIGPSQIWNEFANMNLYVNPVYITP